jgi:hypothetical protein
MGKTNKKKHKDPSIAHDDDGERINKNTGQERYPKNGDKNSGYIVQVLSHRKNDKTGEYTFITLWQGYDKEYTVQLHSLLSNDVGWIYLAENNFIEKVVSREEPDEHGFEYDVIIENKKKKLVERAPRIILELCQAGKDYEYSQHLPGLPGLEPDVGGEEVKEERDDEKIPETEQPERVLKVSNKHVTKEFQMHGFNREGILLEMKIQLQELRKTNKVDMVWKTDRKKNPNATTRDKFKINHYVRTFHIEPKIGIGGYIYVLDLEWHNLTCENISEITCVSLDGSRTFKKFCRYPLDLDEEWDKLIRQGYVTPSPEDITDKSFYEIVRDLFSEFLPSGSVIFTHGPNDSLRLYDSISKLPKEQSIPLLACWRDYGIRFVDSIPFIKQFGDAFEMTEFSKGGALHRVYDICFYNSLVFQKDSKNSLKGSFDVTPPSLLKIINDCIAKNDNILEQEQAINVFRLVTENEEKIKFISSRILYPITFWPTSHLQPVYHTAYVDALVLRNILCTILHWCKFGNIIHNEYLKFVENDKTSKSYYASFGHFITRILTTETHFFREANMTVGELESIWLYNSNIVQMNSEDMLLTQYRHQNSEWKKFIKQRKEIIEDDNKSDDDDDDDDDDESDFIPAGVKKETNLNIGKNNTLCDPIKGKNKALVNTILDIIDKDKTLLGIPCTEKVKLPKEHMPLYFISTAVGKLKPKTIILHDKSCKSLSDGLNRNVSRPEKTIALMYLDTEKIKPDNYKKMGFTVRFCKECKRYKILH